MRLTNSAADEWNGVWSPDGRRIVYRADPQVLIGAVDGDGPPALLIQ